MSSPITTARRRISAILLSVALTLGWLAMSPAPAGANTTLTKTLTPQAVGNPVVQQVGINRGRHMQRESLDITVAAGATIEARVTNGVGDVIVSLMSDDHTTDVNAPALPTDGTWRTVTATAASAVFVRNRPWATAPHVEYRVTSGTSWTTPTYRLGNSPAAFTGQFSSSGSPFALIVDPTFTMLVPRVDLARVTDMSWSQFDDLDAVIEHYRNVFTTFNDWLGIDDGDPDPVHHDLPGAYMVRPDRSGPGLAYYGPSNAVGTNNESVGYYLEGPESWLILHEIGHGYDGMMTGGGGTDMHLGEVWNNVYAYLYQTRILGMTGENWLYRNGGKANDQRIKDATRKAAGSLNFNSVGVDVRLDFLARIADLTGPEGVREFNRALREIRSADGFTGWPTRNDMVAKEWGADLGHDLTAWFDQWQLPLSATVVDDIRDVGQYSAVLPLGDYFPDYSAATAAASQLGLDSPGALVPTRDVRTLQARGSLTVVADIADAAGIESRAVTLWDGSTEVARVGFSNGRAVFGSLPVGTYTLRLPADPATGTVPQRQSVTITAGGSTTADVVYPDEAAPGPVNGSLISLRGLGDGGFASVAHDPATGTVTVSDSLGAPHSYFADEYARITVTSPSGQLFDRSFIGNAGRSLPRTVNVPAVAGTTITITHREFGNRVVETNLETGAAKPSLNATAETTTYVVTEFGLTKAGAGSAEAEFTAALGASLADLAATAQAHPDARLEVRASRLRQAVDQLTVASQRDALLGQYGPLLERLVSVAASGAGHTRVPATLATALASQPGAEAANMLDGDPGTWFHSPWDGTATFPYAIDLDLGAAGVQLGELVMVPHVGSGAGAANGRPGQYRVLAGDSPASLAEVASGTWANDASAKAAQLSGTARYVRLEVLSTYGAPAQRFVAINELMVLGRPALLEVGMTRTDSHGASVQPGDVLTFQVTYTNTSTSPVTVFPRASNLANALPPTAPNCRYAGLGAGQGHACTSARHVVTATDAARGTFTPRIVFDATADRDGTQVLGAGYVAEVPTITVTR